jgi:porin
VGSSRPDDSYGVGLARTQFSGAFVPYLRDNLNLGLDYEGAVEMYYNAAITGWLAVTADLQIINPGLKKALNSSTPPGLMNVDTAVVAGLRFRIRF